MTTTNNVGKMFVARNQFYTSILGEHPKRSSDMQLLTPGDYFMILTEPFIYRLGARKFWAIEILFNEDVQIIWTYKNAEDTPEGFFKAVSNLISPLNPETYKLAKEARPLELKTFKQAITEAFE